AYSYVDTQGTTWTFDGDGWLRTVRDLHQLGLTYQYDSEHRLQSVTAGDGSVTQFDYSQQYQTTIVQPGGRRVVLETDRVGPNNRENMAKEDTVNGQTQRSSASKRGPLIAWALWSPLAARSHYAPAGNWLTKVDRGLGTAYQINPLLAQGLGAKAQK